MQNKKSKAIDTMTAFFAGANMAGKEAGILKEISAITGFVPEKNIWRSSYWGSNQIGASHWLGRFEGKSTVLKIQGVKPEISEIYMISEFSKQNRSKIVRPPILYRHLPWNNAKGYEAIIAEYASGKNVIVDGCILTRENIARFMDYYIEYRKNCIPIKPWLSQPILENNWREALDKLYSTSQKAYPVAPFRKEGDYQLAQKAYVVLSKIYKNVQLEFLHGHFSCKDLIYENKESDNVVLFSNLFWKWKPPFSDAVFAYHWFMHELARVKDISSDQVESQREIWLSEIFKATRALQSNDKGILLKAVLLERAVAGFLLDGFLSDPNKSISEYIIESTRRQAEKLIKELT